MTCVVQGIELDALSRGAGPPLLVLHGFEPLDPAAPIVDLLTARFSLIAPAHPGFGRSPRPDGFETVYDLVHLYLALLDQLPHERVSLLGLSFGGWLAAEIAAAASHRLEKLVLVDALGIKVSGRETADILDVFTVHPDRVRRARWRDSRFAPDFDTMDDEALRIQARNWESLCLYGWQPYLHNPRLARWLSRISVPTLLLWGESDGIVAPAYGEAYARLIPGARFSLVAEAGHHPEIEQPVLVADRIRDFLES
ncbi:MAG: alpha/beta hydrolase [Acetobacteraceae bacterium]|nr:alpha/beta hydrolase [Acetobacteraceae bacterium]